MIVAEAPYPLFRVALSMDDSGVFSAGVPVLAGDPIESIFFAARTVGHSGRLALFENDGWLVGGATVSLTRGIEVTVHDLYSDLLRASRGLHLARIWNYVPAINAPGTAGLDNYQLFCRGRSVAFEQHYGAHFKSFLPSASAVGCTSSVVTVVFAACRATPRHVENPTQVPAYNYPIEHGPRAPSFARATVVPGSGHDTVFISGTSAIRGHTTVAPYSTCEQVDCMLENLRNIASACGLGPNVGASRMYTRHFKVYLRHAADQPAVAAMLEKSLLQLGDIACYLRADICRAQLNVEIEATLWPTAPTSLSPL